MSNYKVAAPWLLRALGLGKFLDRLIHVPRDVLPFAAEEASVTEEQWRRVEAVQRKIVETGILMRVPVLVLAMLFLFTGNAWATDYAVLPAEDWRTKLSLIVNGAGDRIILEDGVHPGGGRLSTKSGFTIMARNRGRAIVKGNTAALPDALKLYRCKEFVLDGIVFQDAARCGADIDLCSVFKVQYCTFKDNTRQGVQAGESTAGMVEYNLFVGTKVEWGLYISGGSSVKNWVIRYNRMMGCGKGGLQINNQGATGQPTLITVTDNSFLGNNITRQGADVNIIGASSCKFLNLTLSDGGAGGISFSGGATDNLVNNCLIVFNAGKGRTGVQATTGTHTVTNTIVRVGKAFVSAIAAVSPGAITQAGNTVLPYAVSAASSSEAGQ